VGGAKIPNPASIRALILAPQGRDGAVASHLLSNIGIASTVCGSLAEFHDSLGDDTGFVVVAEEAMRSADLRNLTSWVNAQQTWSDLPFIILTRRSDGIQFHPETPRLAELLGNVTLLERPFHPATFVSVVKSAFKGRLRQYEARARIAELRESQELLEKRVAERTADLKRAHDLVIEEIAQREQAEEKLRQSQKMEMIGQLTGGVAHDFNNLLMAVIGNLDLLRKRTSTDQISARLVDGAIQGAQRGAALTQRLLAFARRQELKVQPTDLAELLVGMNDLIQRSIGSQIELALRIPDHLPRVLVDANQIELAVLNLVVNARDAMPSGGTLIVEIDQPSISPPSSMTATSCLRLSVVDTGIGMDVETLRKATEPFFSTKELGKGTGLGLSMIHGLARQLGGALRLESAPGSGTRAELWLPTTTKPAAQHLEDTTALPERVVKMTVLVVDDDPLISMSTAMMVEDLGHDVVEANSGNEALGILKNGRNIDLLITDFSMPKMNGAQLAEAARQLRSDLPILLATGYADLPTGTDHGLPRLGKPYQQEQLASAIAETLKGKNVQPVD
jgi:signal transduction histidine kinase/ActR/RegA family two-component response regulator